MNTYLVNFELMGYKTITLEEATEMDSSNIIIFIDTDVNNSIKDYYNRIKELIISRNRVILVTIGEDKNEVGKALGALMCSYNKYDIYSVESKEIIDSNYIEIIKERTPGYTEVCTFVGGEITAYSEISTILLGIESLVSEGNIEGLGVFLEQHMNSIEHLTSILDSMKQIVEESNSQELASTIENLKKEVEDYKERVVNTENSIIKLESENKTLASNLEAYKRKLQEEIENAESLKGTQSDTEHMVIKEYKETNTSIIKCKTQRIIYFKEISRIPYINSMVLALMTRIKMQCKVRLLIYDNNNSLDIYRPLTGIDTKEYMSKRELYSGNKEVMLIVEPNQAILKDILEYSKEPNDVVIIYDRMKKKENLVSGNNVHKFYVMNSSFDYKQSKNIFNITDKSSIITMSRSIGKDVLDIPTIEQYQEATEASKKSKYFKLVTAISKKLLIDSILQKVRFKDIIKK